LKIDVLTLFPAMFAGPLDESIIKRARDSGLLDLKIHQLRDYTHDRHKTVDDRPFGGGPGMLLKPEPIFEAVEAIARDRTRVTVSGFTQLGLVEMTRKRTRESLAHLLCEPCPTCQGRGEVKTARSVCHDILREILREARQFNPKEFRLLASAAVVEMLLDEESQHLAGLSDFIGKPISLRAEPFPSPEQYDIVLL